MINRFFRKDLEEKVEKLEARILETEKENDKLRKRLSKREEKKESDPAKFQETAEELKKSKNQIDALEQRITALTAEKEESSAKSSAKDYYLSKRESLELLRKIASVREEKENLISVYLPPKENIPAQYDPNGEISAYIGTIKSETGFVGFFDLNQPSAASFFAAPPFPPEEAYVKKGASFDTKAAEEIFTKKRHAAFILGHAGESYVGLATESGLIKGELIRSSVKEKHSKGGWSQKRFERLREEDIKHHTEKAGEFFSGLLEEFNGITDVIVVGGDRKTGSDIAGQRDIPTIYRQFETKPDRHCGEKLIKEIWSARWYRI
ncbi:MAG: hypothetical protein JXQ82_00825 [Methanomicrobiaceae archaeon]|nr:hypothetical protein [Methanomicrobiaceae archaeon]